MDVIITFLEKNIASIDLCFACNPLRFTGKDLYCLHVSGPHVTLSNNFFVSASTRNRNLPGNNCIYYLLFSQTKKPVGNLKPSRQPTYPCLVSLQINTIRTDLQRPAELLVPNVIHASSFFLSPLLPEPRLTASEFLLRFHV